MTPRAGKLSSLLVALLLVSCGQESGSTPSSASQIEPLESVEASGSDGPALPDPVSPSSTPSPKPKAAAALIDDATPRSAQHGALPWPDAHPVLNRGLLAGTWSPDEEEGFAHSWFDETALVETFSMRRAGRRFWKGVSGAKALELDVLTRDRDGPIEAYFYSISSRGPTHGLDPFAEGAYEDADAVLHIRHEGRLRAWWDGELVLEEDAPPIGTAHHAQVSVTLSDAFDVLLLKLGRDDPAGSLDIEVRLSDVEGAPVAGQQFTPRRQNEYPREID